MSYTFALKQPVGLSVNTVEDVEAVYKKFGELKIVFRDCGELIEGFYSDIHVLDINSENFRVYDANWYYRNVVNPIILPSSLFINLSLRDFREKLGFVFYFKHET